jgi:hypothetical protein
MPNINITVREKIAHTISDTCIVCGNSDYVAVFDFDAEWDAYEVKTARFIWGGTYTDVAFAGNECPVPVIPDAVSVLVGVFAGELHTTTAAAVGVRRSILGGSETEAEVSHEIKDAFGKMLAGKIDAPQVAQVGEVLTVEAVDADGKPTKWKTAHAAAEQKQANWAQNDETAADFVRNRPGGYYGDPVTVDEEIYSGEIEQAQSEMEVDWLLVAGQTYKVTIGEVDKTYTAFADAYSGISGVTIGDGTIEDAAESGKVFVLFTAEIEKVKAALLACPEVDVGKTIRVTQFGTAREVHKIPAEFLDIPPVEQVPQVVTVTLVERDGKQYGSIPFKEVLAAQRGGKEVRLLDNYGRYYQFTGVYNAKENICFHSFQQHKLWWAVMERSGLIEIYGYNLGQQELTYSADSTYTSLYDEKSFSCSFFGSWTRMKFFITLRLLTRTAGAYVQLRYDKGRKILNICKHEEIGTDKAILCGELEKTTTGNYTYLVTLRLRSENGTPHPARFDFCDELNLDSGETYSSPGIEILSGTEDKFEARQSVRKYGR